MEKQLGCFFVKVFLAFLAIFVLSIYSGEVLSMEIKKKILTAVPPIDRNIPDNIETATFALG